MECHQLLHGNDVFDYVHIQLIQHPETQQSQWMQTESLLHALKLLGVPYEANRNSVLQVDVGEN